MSSNYPIFAFFGVMLIVLGILAILLPYLLQIDFLKKLEEIPTIIIYVYRHNGFYFVTSPILIIISIIVLLYRLLT